jgi:mono/diheme cytochrome c family protein
MLSVRFRLLTALLVSLLISGCGETRHIKSRAAEKNSLPPSEKALLCTPIRDSKAIPEVQYLGKVGSKVRTFQDLRDSVNSACMSCHLSPARSGGFSYLDSYRGKEVVVNGETLTLPGFFEAGEKMQEQISAAKMPPRSIREKNPEAFDKIGAELKAWISAGKPEGRFEIGSDAARAETASAIQAATDLGECTPRAEAVGTDYQRDRTFASLEKLPENLYETDLFSLDAFELARRGTVAYNVEYPLWADNSSKGRWVHVPARIGTGFRLEKQSIHYDATTQKFVIPDNTRFYKTFYKPLVLKNGTKRFRRVETRIIVVRTPYEKSLFGTYRWDDTEQSATLLETPYRDGTPWKDVLLDVVVNEKSGETRKYALPAKHRCIECHMGSDTQTFVLGFTPLQINRRKLGEAGREEETPATDLSQADRLLKYGVLDGFEAADQLPKLEWVGQTHPRNTYEIRAQGYFLGNCYSCHNPLGFAILKNGVKLDFSPGQIYQFNTKQRSIHFPPAQERRLVDPQGELEKSYIYSKMAKPPSEQGMFSQMPLHIPALPDCRGLEVVGKWIQSWESMASAASFKPECSSKKDFPWIEQDFTWPETDGYVPRRQDWNTAMPERVKNLEFPEGLRTLSNKSYAVGYWSAKAECSFPQKVPSPEEIRPWMKTPSGAMKRPFGEVYQSRPGAWFFTTTCVKCHGPQGDGNSTFAEALLNWSGGSVRVANLMKGLFGNGGTNLKTFDVTMADGRQKNLGGNYLLWMATDGTRVKFPDEAANYLGKHKAQMLNLFREKCASHILSAQQQAKPFFQDYQIFHDVCFYNNRSPDDPAIQFNPDTGAPLNPAALEEWMDQAALNSGWVIFDYLSDAAKWKWSPSSDSCEKVFPKNQSILPSMGRGGSL